VRGLGTGCGVDAGTDCRFWLTKSENLELGQILIRVDITRKDSKYGTTTLIGQNF
jgi:hypothetical protein